MLENDERWPLEPALELAALLGVPVVFDVFHHELAPSFPGESTRDLVLRVGETWSPRDGRQEVHFSTQAPGKRPGAHATRSTWKRSGGSPPRSATSRSTASSR